MEKKKQVKARWWWWWRWILKSIDSMSCMAKNNYSIIWGTSPSWQWPVQHEYFGSLNVSFVFCTGSRTRWTTWRTQTNLEGRIGSYCNNESKAAHTHQLWGGWWSFDIFCTITTNHVKLDLSNSECRHSSTTVKQRPLPGVTGKWIKPLLKPAFTACVYFLLIDNTCYIFIRNTEFK